MIKKSFYINTDENIRIQQESFDKTRIPTIISSKQADKIFRKYKRRQILSFFFPKLFR